jgi:hypothetical protein
VLGHARHLASRCIAQPGGQLRAEGERRGGRARQQRRGCKRGVRLEPQQLRRVVARRQQAQQQLAVGGRRSGGGGVHVAPQACVWAPLQHRRDSVRRQRQPPAAHRRRGAGR